MGQSQATSACSCRDDCGLCNSARLEYNPIGEPVLDPFAEKDVVPCQPNAAAVVVGTVPALAEGTKKSLSPTDGPRDCGVTCIKPDKGAVKIHEVNVNSASKEVDLPNSEALQNSRSAPGLKEDFVLEDDGRGVPTFELRLEKRPGEQSFGIAHVPMDDGTPTLLVMGVAEAGPVARHNEGARKGGSPSAQLEVNDRIVDVRGKSADLEAMQKNLRGKSVILTVERWPPLMEITLEKRKLEDKFGISLDSFDGSTLRVASITDGLVQNWNFRAAASRRFHEIVVPGMDVESVNDISTDLEAMHVALLNPGTVKIAFRRAVPETY